MSGIRGRVQSSPRVQDVSVSEVCVCVPSSPCGCCLYFSDTWNGEPMTGTHYTAMNGRLQEPLAGVPLHRKIDRHRARAAKLAVSLSFALRCSQSAPLSAPAADAQARGRYPPATASYSSHLKPPKTLPIISYAFCLVPCAHFKCLTIAKYYHALARISPFGPASFRCFFFPFSPVRRSLRTTDRPTDDRRGPDLPAGP